MIQKKEKTLKITELYFQGFKVYHKDNFLSFIKQNNEKIRQ